MSKSQPRCHVCGCFTSRTKHPDYCKRCEDNSVKPRYCPPMYAVPKFGDPPHRVEVMTEPGALCIPIAFDEKMLKSLLSGGVITIKHKPSGTFVEIILSDIGWYEIDNAFHDAKESTGRTDWMGYSNGEVSDLKGISQLLRKQ